jgi:hypothetical protein
VSEYGSSSNLSHGDSVPSSVGPRALSVKDNRIWLKSEVTNRWTEVCIGSGRPKQVTYQNI